MPVMAATASISWPAATAPQVSGRAAKSSATSSATLTRRAVLSARSANLPMAIRVRATRGGTAPSLASVSRGRTRSGSTRSTADAGTHTSFASVPAALDTVCSLVLAATRPRPPGRNW